MSSSNTDITILKVELLSERLSSVIDIREAVTDIEIYEHLDKPYITAVLTFSDDNSIVNDADILGGEQIRICLKTSANESKEIIKTFYIYSVISNSRSNDQAEAFVLNLIEDTAYVSNLINVNKSYTGKSSVIVGKIAANFLGKNVLTSGNDKQLLKLIVPNLNPLEAMSWIKNQTTTVDGYPFYLYSTLVDEELYFVDLGTMLSKNPVISTSFQYAQSKANVLDEKERLRNILSFTVRNTENLFQLAKQGLVGSTLEYFDILANKKHSLKFDIAEDVFKPLIDQNIVTTNPVYSTEYKLNGKSFNQLKSRTISQIGGSKVFQNESSKLVSYGEYNFASDYKLNMISKSMDEALRKSPMQVTIYGKEFLFGEASCTIGEIIRLEFASTHPEKKGKPDRKKSGNYLIHSAKHNIKKEGYELQITGIKLGNEDL